MGAGKSTLGPQLARRLGRAFTAVDEVVEKTAGKTVAELFEERGEAEFRMLEERAAADLLARRPLAVVELGGGALASAPTRTALAEHAFALLLETTPDEAWGRVSGSGRPLAQDRERFDALFEERRGIYDEVANGRARDPDGAVLAAAGVHVGAGAATRLRDLIPVTSAVELVVDATVEGLHGESVRAALGDRVSATHVVPAGEAAKSADEVARLWSALRGDRGSTVVGLGGGSTLDAAGFVAATYLRGVAWAPVPTTLVAQVDAAIGGKTGIDLPDGKNLVGVFHWPARVVVDSKLLATLPADELANGRAEVVKTGLLAGEPLWELEVPEQVRRCAAFKAAVCLRDPLDRGDRAQLNLGHTFAHALEAASGFELSHGHAVALGLLAALRLSGLRAEIELVEEILRPQPVAVDRERAWQALQRDKKVADGKLGLVLLEEPGRPRIGVEVDPASVRAALDELIA